MYRLVDFAYRIEGGAKMGLQGAAAAAVAQSTYVNEIVI